MKNIVLLGSTGSVGRNVLDVVRAHPEKFRVIALAGNRNVDLLAAQAEEFVQWAKFAPRGKRGLNAGCQNGSFGTLPVAQFCKEANERSFVAIQIEPMQALEMEFLSPPHKLIRFFRSSRDKWKTKHQKVKKDLKLAQNQVRAVEKSRTKWRQVAEGNRDEVARLQAELEEIKNSFA